MARQADGVRGAESLRRIANEGFADLEAAKRMLQNPLPLPYSNVYQVVQVPGKKEINHKEAAIKYGGEVIMDYYPRKKA